jgi:hypothetical protein
MIKGISAGQGIIVQGGGVPHISKSYSSSTTYLVGSVMFDLDQQCLKVYDGSAWQTCSGGFVQISFDNETKSLLEWAKQKRQEEHELDALAQTNPTIKDLIRQIKEKEEQILIVQQLIKEEVKVEAN